MFIKNYRQMILVSLEANHLYLKDSTLQKIGEYKETEELFEKIDRTLPTLLIFLDDGYRLENPTFLVTEKLRLSERSLALSRFIDTLLDEAPQILTFDQLVRPREKQYAIDGNRVRILKHNLLGRVVSSKIRHKSILPTRYPIKYLSDVLMLEVTLKYLSRPYLNAHLLFFRMRSYFNTVSLIEWTCVLFLTLLPFGFFVLKPAETSPPERAVVTHVPSPNSSLWQLDFLIKTLTKTKDVFSIFAPASVQKIAFKLSRMEVSGDWSSRTSLAEQNHQWSELNEQIKMLPFANRIIVNKNPFHGELLEKRRFEISVYFRR